MPTSLFRPNPKAQAAFQKHRGRLAVEQLEERCLFAVDVILEWNVVALEAVRRDYDIGKTPDQGGPTSASRALAIVHVAMFDAFNSINRQFTPYLTLAPQS